MRILSKLAITLGLALCTATSSFAAKSSLPQELETFPSTFKNQRTCTQGVFLLNHHYETMALLEGPGWRNLIMDGGVADPWDVVADQTWDVITMPDTFAKIGAMRSGMQSLARLIWQGSTKGEIDTRQVFVDMVEKCYTIHKEFELDSDISFDITEETFNGPGGQDIGWYSYPGIHKIVGYKMDYSGNREQ